MGNKISKARKSRNRKQVISQKRYLCDELIFEEILTRLPVKSILRFNSVSKQWYSTLSSPDFAKAHLKKSPFSHPCAPVNTLFIQSHTVNPLFIKPPPNSNCYLFSYDDEVDQISHNLVKINPEFWVENADDLRLTGSCNGLICITAVFACKYPEYFILWNPATLKLNKYPVYLDGIERAGDFFVTTGFGYVSSVDDYKFVGISKVLEHKSTNLFAQIFSLRENRWRKIDLDHNLRFLDRQGVLVSENLYWCAWNDKTYNDKTYNDKVHTIVSFDLAIERFDVIEVDWDVSDVRLGVMRGCLCKFGYTVIGDKLIDILEPEPPAIGLPKGLISNMFSQMIGCTKTDKSFVTSGSMLGIVDTCTRPGQYKLLFNTGDDYITIARYVPSLVSPFPTEATL